MPIEFRCSQCGRLLKTPDDTAGRQAQCPACGGLSIVPGAPEPTAPLLQPAEGPPTPGTAAEPAAAALSPTGGGPTGPAGGGGQDATPFAADFTRVPAESRQYAAQRVSGPATALAVLAWLNFIESLLLIGLAALILVVAQDPRLRHRLPPGADPAEMVMESRVYLIKGLLDIPVSIFLLIGAGKMKQLNNYALAVAAAIVAVVPCIAPCCCGVVSIGFGIWALVVLCDPLVRSAFRS